MQSMDASERQLLSVLDFVLNENSLNLLKKVYNIIIEGPFNKSRFKIKKSINK